MVDISSRGLEALGYDSLEQFAMETGVYMVRCDFGIKEEEMLKASKYCALAVNASTLDYRFAAKLREAGAEVWAVHNFYPRPETGLDEEYFLERNRCLKELGIKTAAFITGDVKKRGPLKEGLPTLESHRNLPPYLQYLQMTEMYQMDMILVGDPGLSEEQRKLIERKKQEGIISVPADLNEKYQHLYGKVWTIREDSPKWIARLNESRGYAAIGKKITAENCVERVAGSITIDNEKITNFIAMSKILVIGVGGAGRETVKHMKDTGIPEADYITFGKFEDDDERKDIPHYNLITMNGHCGISPTHRPSVFKHLAENVEDDIREILEYHINESNLIKNE